MDWISTTTNRGVYTRGKMSPLGNDRQADVTNWEDFGDSSDSLLFGTEKDGTIPPYSLYWRDMEVPAPRVAPRDEPRQILERGIRRAFFSTTNGIDDESWDDVRARLPDMTLGEARGIWQTIANEMAVDYFGEDGHVDVERLQTWMDFLGDTETFGEEPFCLIPHAELMRSQINDVMRYLFLNRNGARDRLDAATGIDVGQHGRDILTAMVRDGEQPLKPAVAIAASLFVPHRQFSLPTCAINSRINEEIRNHPERLIRMYAQILNSNRITIYDDQFPIYDDQFNFDDDQFNFDDNRITLYDDLFTFGGNQITLPSGYVILLRPMVDGFITVDLKNGEKGKDTAFKDIMDGDPTKFAEQIAELEEEGIEYVDSEDPAEKYKLKMPIHNINDVLFAHFFQASFGNKKIDCNGEYGTALIYAGHRVSSTMHSAPIPLDGSNFPTGIAELKTQAEAQQQLGYSYMRVVTRTTEEAIVGGHDHAENIDILALLSFDSDNMELGKAYVFGDRNWCGQNMSQDIPRLAVRNADGTIEFGTLRNGSQFEKEDITHFWVYNTDVEVHDTQYWAQFRP